MSPDKNTEFNNIIIYILVGMSGLVLTLIGVVYNTVKKNIDKLFKKVSENSEHIAGIEARCEERKRNESNK